MACEIALLELRRNVDVRLATVNGRLALLIQRSELNERRIDEQTRLLDELDARLAATEREQVTRGHLEVRFRHTVAVLMLIAAGVSALAATTVAIVGKA